MAKLTIAFGAILIALGIWAYIATGSEHPTALIPTWFGVVLLLAGAFANSENPKQRMLWMHIAVTVGLLGFLGAGSMAIVEYVKAHGGPLSRPVAVEDQAAMAVICLMFVALCVRSFIAARKARKLAA